MATREEIDRIKRSWLNDPTYDLWAVEGFEEHESELRRFQEKTEAQWRREREDRLRERARELECSVPLVEYLEGLEARLARLAEDFRFRDA